MVAEIPESFALAECERLLVALPHSRYIFKARIVDGFELYHGQGRQLVYVEKVFAGEGITSGDCVYVTSDRWIVFWGNVMGTSMERGFVNVMEVGKDYLFFCEEQIDALDNSIPVYRTSRDSTITPIFCYENTENVIVPPNDMSTYVSYLPVKDNEFFACTHMALNAWENLKSALLSKYK